jgi:succinoglycan biosynthesis transport protein ExoP
MAPPGAPKSLEVQRPMSDHDSRERSDRKGSLLSLVPPSEGEEGSARSSGTGTARLAEAADRHLRARASRETAQPQRIGRANATPVAADRGFPEPFAEQERELQALLAGHAAVGEERHRDVSPDAGFDSTAARRRQAGRPAWADIPASTPSTFDEDPYWRPLIDPMKVIGGVIRSRWIIAATTIAGAAIAAAIALSTPKVYVAVTELIVDPRQLRITQNELTDGGLSTEATLAIVENQVRVLQSGNVLGKVVDTLGLDKDPEFNGTGDDGIGIGIGNIVSTLRSFVSSGSEAGDPSVRQRALAIEHLSEVTDVERGGKTFVVTVAAKTESPDKSALIANTLTEVFLEAYGSIQAGSAGRASDELSSRLSELRAGVEAAEREVETFKSQNDIIDAQGRLITDDEIVKLNDQLSTARARTFELQARADSTRNLTVDAVLAGNLPEQMNSPVLTEMRTQYALLRQEADRVAARLGPRHPERVAIEAQVEAARQRVEQELRLVASSIQVELRRAVQLEQELAARLAQLKARQGGLSGELVTLRELEREAAAKRAVYEAFLLRARETGEQKDLNTANVSVISKATPPLEPSGPSRTMLTLLGAFIGFGAGAMFGVARGTYESLRDNAGSGRSGGMPRAPSAPPTGQLRTRRPEASGDDMQTGAQDAPDRTDIRRDVGARSEAQNDTMIDRMAGKAKEADMYHVRPQMAWNPAGAPEQDRDQAGYGAAVQQPRYWPQDGYHGIPHAPEPQAAWMMQQPDMQQPRHPAMPQQAPMGYYAPPMAQGVGPGYPTAGYPQMQPQAYGYPQPPYPMGYPHPSAAQPAMMPERTSHYVPQAASWGYTPAQRAPEPVYQPVQPQAMPQRQPQPAQAGWPQPVQAPAMPQRQSQPAQTAWQQPVQPAAAPAREQAAPVAQPASAESSAIEEIRESLREFRQALRDLAETRSRRRFL